MKGTGRGGCKTGKFRYHDEATAKVALVGSLAAQALRKSTRRRECRVYQCNICKGWHLTSAEFDPAKGAA